MDILDDMGVSKLSAKVFFFFFFKKGNYSFKLNDYVVLDFRNTDNFDMAFIMSLYEGN